MDIFGTPGNDFLTGTPEADRILGLDGHDSLAGLGGKDILSGGSGRDFIEGGEGDDGDKDNPLDGGADSDFVFGGNGNDYIVGEKAGVGGGNDFLDGGAGEDRLFGDFGDDSLFGGPGNDPELDGGARNDLLNGGDGTDILQGGSGFDTLIGGAGPDTLRGDTADDFLDGGPGFDNLEGGEGFDTAVYSSFLSGVHADLRTQRVAFGDAPGTRIDFLSSIEGFVGTQGSDIITGTDGFNRLDGQGGNDLIADGPGFDLIFGGEGIDVFSDTRSAGDDRFTGGAEGDLFIFSGPMIGSDVLPFEGDIVRDFERGSDTIRIIGFGLRFGDLDDGGVRGVLDDPDPRVSVTDRLVDNRVVRDTVIDLSDLFGRDPGFDTITVEGITGLDRSDVLFVERYRCRIIERVGRAGSLASRKVSRAPGFQ